MEIFLSWSGDRSKAVASALRNWLPLVLHYEKEIPMNIDNVIQQIKNNNTAPFPCEYPDEGGDLEFAGTLEEFLAFVAEHCHKPIGVARNVFKENSFQFVIDIDGEDGEEEIDVRELNPELKRFEQYLNTDSSCRLLAWMKDTNATIEFNETDPWYLEFFIERARTVNARRAKQEEMITQARDVRRNAEQELLAKVESLIDDPAFCALNLQRHMYDYACQKIEGLDRARKEHVLQVIRPIWDKLGKNRNLK
jgi:hypothetical protein